MNKQKSTVSLNSLNSKNPQNSEMEELKKSLHIKEEQLNKLYDMAQDDASNQTTKEQILYAFKVIKVVKQDLADPKQNLADEIKEICDSLDDYGICVTYVIANSRKSSKEILKLLSPYLLKNANDFEYIKQYIPNIEECIKESNKSEAMELLAKPELKEYLEQKSAKLANKSPTPPPFPTDTDMEEDSTATEQDIEAVGAGMVEVTGESSTTTAAE